MLPALPPFLLGVERSRRPAMEASLWVHSPYLSSGGEGADPGAASCAVWP